LATLKPRRATRVVRSTRRSGQPRSEFVRPRLIDARSRRDAGYAGPEVCCQAVPPPPMTVREGVGPSICAIARGWSVSRDGHAMRRYRWLVDDSARWEGFEFRSGDIVISTPKKCGTTWTQMLCALLIFDGSAFPEPLEQLSPWLDMCNRPIDEVRAALARQTHRRFIKTHTPLDGLALRDDVTYVVTGRDPRDAAVSFEHHAKNMDYDHFLELRAAAVGVDDLDHLLPRRIPLDDALEQYRWFVRDDALAGPPTLAAILHHLGTAW